MALPALRDLLPDHIFYNPTSALTARPPPPPSAPLYSYPQGGSSSKPNSTVPVSSPSYSAVQPPYPNTSVGTVPPQPRYPYPHRASTHEGQASPSGNGGAAFDARHFHSGHPEINTESSAALDDRRASDVRSRSRSLGLSASAGLDGDEDDGRREHDGASIGAASNNADEDRSKKHICPTCKKSFNRPSSLKIHMNTHTGVKPYACPYPGCGRVFNVSSNMRRHYRNHANRVPPAPLPLPLPSTSGRPLALPPLANVSPHAPPGPDPSTGVYGRTLPYEQTWVVHGQPAQRYDEGRAYADNQYLHFADRHHDSYERETDLPPALVDSVNPYSGTAGDGRRGSGPEYESRRWSSNASGRVDYTDRAVASRGTAYAEHVQSEEGRDGRHYYNTYPSSQNNYAPTSTSTSYPESARGYHDAPLDVNPPAHYPYPYSYPIHHSTGSSSSTATAAYTNSSSINGDTWTSSSITHRRSTSSGSAGFDPRPAGSRAGETEAGVPPTPPYTNEAAVSPPAYAPPLVQSQHHSLPRPSGYLVESVTPLPFDSFAAPTADNSQLGMRRGRGEEDQREREQEPDDSDPRVNGSWEESIRRMGEENWTWHDRDERDEASEDEALRELLDPETGLEATYDALVRIVSGSRPKETSMSTPASGEGQRSGDGKVCGAGKVPSRTSTCPLGASGDARQQPSPDTPSLRVPVLHEEERSASAPASRVDVDTHEKYQDGNKEEKEKEAQTRPSHARRESLQIASIMNPTEEPPNSKTKAHEESQRMTKNAPTPSVNATQDGGKVNAVPGSVIPESSSIDATADKAKKPTREVGKTPGAAPPPPYPLLKRPSEKMLEIDEEDEREEPLPVPVRAKSTGGKGGRRTKKRKRR